MCTGQDRAVLHRARTTPYVIKHALAAPLLQASASGCLFQRQCAKASSTNCQAPRGRAIRCLACPSWRGMQCWCTAKTGRGASGPPRATCLENCRQRRVSEIYHMKLKNILGLAGAAAISLGLATGAFAEDKVVKIGGVFPMSGGAASTGTHVKAAFDVVMDIVNNRSEERRVGKECRSR